ncbi:MAG: GNAT family N-acetyltransferase, partial [Lachnospiraceae bacterium]|nr:GNAT family N-acetyltransferase [Lachnospiraceae bacterium]
MTIKTLREEEKKAYTPIIPEGLDISDSLVLVTIDELRAGSAGEFFEQALPASSKRCRWHLRLMTTAPVVGIMVLSTIETGRWSIDYLYVAPNYRRRGVAKNLLSYGSFLVMMMGAELISADILDEDDAGSDIIKKFLINSGFSVDSEREIAAVSLDTVKNSLEPIAKKVDMKGIKPLSALSKGSMWDEITAYFYENIREEDLYVPLHNASYYNRKFSMVQLDRAGTCSGMILISDIDDGNISLDYLWCRDSFSKNTAKLLVAAMQAVDRDCDIFFQAETESAKTLAKRLLGDDCRTKL